MAQSHHLAVNFLFVFLLFFFLVLTHALPTRGDVQFPGNSDSYHGTDYIVFINTYLTPESIAGLAEEIQRWWKWRWAGNTCGRLLINLYLPTDGGWQDFVMVRVLAPHRKHSMQCVQKGLQTFDLFLSCVGRVSIIRVVKDFLFGGNRILASAAPRKGFTTARPLYPRRYFGLSATMNWTGRGVRIALLDTGLDPHLVSSSSLERPLNYEGTASTAQPLRMCTSFVPGLPCENNQDGHGTFSVSVMAGNISLLKGLKDGVNGGKGAASDNNCVVGCKGPLSSRMQYLGMAPGADVHMLRVFDDNRDTRTSWCVAALNFALQWGAHIVNLSFGGIDYYDTVFTEKITELAKKGVVVVAATGNEGPGMGSLHNPADQTEVIAVGSLGTRGRRLTARVDDAETNKSSIHSTMRWISTFSGRGPSTWEMPYGTGRVRPDLVALGEHVLGVGRDRRLGTLSLWVSHGTSVATPIVAGIVALCIDALQHLYLRRNSGVNVAMIKQVLMETAVEINPKGSAMRVIEAALRKEEHDISAPRRRDWWRRGGSSASSRRDGIAMARSLLHYRNVLQYSRMSQGAGEVCPMCALSRVEAVGQQRTFLRGFSFPREIDATGAHQLPHGEEVSSALPQCLVNWPYCEQPLFPSATPVEYTVNIYYPQCHAARLTHTTPWIGITGARGMCSPHRRGRCHASNIDVLIAKQLLFLQAQASHTLDAYSGVVSLFALSPSNASSVRWTPSSPSTTKVLEAGVIEKLLGHFDLIEVSGFVKVTYTCNTSYPATLQGPIHKNETWCNSECVTIPFKIPVVPRPPRARRMAFDISHQWFYPPDFVPGDDAYTNPLPKAQHQHKEHQTRPESHGVYECDSDHPHTNMVPLLLFLRRVMGIFVEVPLVSYLSLGVALNGNATAFNLHWRIYLQRYYRNIGTLLLLDPELPLMKEERAIVANAVLRHQLHVVIFSEWYSEQVARGLFFCDATQNQTSSPLFWAKQNMTASNVVGEDNEQRAQGLKGACHVPSLNAFLCDISQGTLQLDDDRVVDGALSLASTSTFFSPYHLGWSGQAVYRYFGRMSAAGVLRWPPARNACSTILPQPEQMARTTMVCGMEKLWARELHEIARAGEEGKGEGGSFRGANDVLRKVHPEAFIPLFGFAGVGNGNTEERSRSGLAEGGKMCRESKMMMGRVAVFTDTSSLSSFSSPQASLHVLDKLVYDLSSRSLGSSEADLVTSARVRDSLASLVTHESESPSFAFSIVRDFWYFVYTGELPEFTKNSECRRYEAFANALNKNETPVHAFTTSSEVKRGDGVDDGGKFESLLSTLFASAPRRVALAKRLREVLSAWETVMMVADDDCSFRNNELQLETSASEKMIEPVSSLFLLLVIVMLICILLCTWRRGQFALSGCLGCDKGKTMRTTGDKKEQ
ncbi:putative subtilisin-like serine peptidase [Trypanosoma rangeli]|uniref:Putative subtilisin-like serine peptidase n=1 Tax=Trypanosoma rangeli TaxID=5698 RepID=A0A422NGF2_TRYRA|nr:putative subtilisin-like serine peptidase [Trypanosoma rangeli]RNF04519.1 putative subtilisin-like serine peptidase [Trypanosoma rangeli]|eukprot:RNF04519.1 putative subtilisin-like serine peptidase [Trypanosoma rangeli]